MITMLWKELRENAKWGALALLGLLMAEFYAINQEQFFGFYVQESAPLCKSSFLMITTFGNAAVGLVLGLLQFLPEQRRDQWAALLHRPVPRATIFRGKAVAGLLLYLVATLVPFAACAWYASKPGHFAAPFTPRMIFPGVADICAGLMYYFAALFVSLQRGAWWGTRAFGVLAALSGSFVVTTSYLPFYVAVETAVVMSLALFTAAWGAMLTNGTFQGRPWLARFAALAVVFYGVCAAGDIANLIWSAFQRPHYYFGSNYIVTSDGIPVRAQTSSAGHSLYFDLTGNPITLPALSHGTTFRNTIQLSSLSSYVLEHAGLRSPQFFRPYRSGEIYAQMVNSYGEVNGEIWYYVPEDRLFEGFNRYNKAPVGSMGQNGYTPDSIKAQPFRKRLAAPGYFQVNSIVRFGNTVYFLDLGDHAARPIFTAVDNRISGSGNISPYAEDPALRDLGAVVLPDRTVVLDSLGRIVTTLHYDRDVNQWGALSIGMKSLQGPVLLEYTPSGWIPYDKSRHMPSYLEVYDLQGHLLKSYTLPPIAPEYQPRTWQQYVEESLGAPAFFYGDLLYDKIGATLGSHRLAGELHERFHQGWGYTKDVAIRITVLSFILALIALVWARRSDFTWRQAWRWALFVFGFNLAGLITFRLAADWTVRIKCPSCGRPRRVDDAACPHCGAAWPVPARDGTEIVDDVQPAPREPGVAAS